ncbi:sialidase-3-like isoform X2 [Channa argus]|uniref:sialidase-3-like isoform X2 n=1 Tax=Channa argus TaxID=215402 RepID=UPI0035230ED7
MSNKPSSDSELEKRVVFIPIDKHVYRIPALVYDRDEKILLAFAEKRRTKDDAHTLALVMKRGTVNEDKTVTFEEPEIELLKKADHGDRPMNPCPVFEKSSKTLFLFFIFVEGDVSEHRQIRHYDNKARLCYIKSTDAGKSWSEVIHLSENQEEIQKQMKTWATFAVGPGHGLQAHDDEGQDQKPKWLLYSHPTDTCRKDLGVYLNESPHDSTTWSKPWIINRGPSGYSDLVYMDDGWFACLMECGEKSEIEQIAVKVFSYNDIKKHIKE